MHWVLWVLLTALFTLSLLILARTLAFRPRKQEEVAPCSLDTDTEAAHAALRELVRCRTVSHENRELEDEAEFQRLIDLLPTLYPHVLATCSLREFEERGLLFRWEGKSHAHATVLMAHYDVVPADAEGWRKPPFDGVIEDGVLWGRGTLDTKSTLNAIFFAADCLIRDGFVPEEDVYFAISGSEEIRGAGALNIASYFSKEGISVSLVLDEGGAVVEGAFPGVGRSTALIGIAEKGVLDVEYRVRTAGGHASAPRPQTAIGQLAAAVTEVEEHPAKMQLTEPVRKMFDTLGRHASFPYRMLFANLFLFKPLLSRIAVRRGGEMNALLRTTVAFTRMHGSEANNVLPSEADIVSNIRLSPADTADRTVARLRRVIDNPAVEIRPLQATNPSPVSRTDGKGWETLRRAVRLTWPEAIVSPYLMLQCSDSRHFTALSDSVYRFSAMSLTAEERRTIHGRNERIRLEEIDRSVEFYLRLMKML